jgi:cyclophilin family peptidyl-prolyl cis-trans isomerase
MKPLLLAAFVLLAIAPRLAAQEGKPLYEVSVFRADSLVGTFELELFPDIAPLHVRNFDSLVSIGFFDSTAFHRVIPGFVIQGGDPNTKYLDESTWGLGNDSQATVPAEFNPISHQRGILSAARSDDPNSATSQFFVVVAPATSLDKRYTVYGRVTSGMNIVDTIVRAPTEPNQFGENSRPITKIIMKIRRTGIDTTMPGPTVLRYPTDDTSRVRTSVNLRWDATPGAILYEIQLSKSPQFEVIAIKDSVAGTTATVGQLEAGHQRYYWRVRASNGGRRGEFSEVRDFTTGIAKTVLGTPANGTTNVSKPVQLTWSPVNGASLYRVQIGTALGFGTILLDTTGLTTTSVTINGLAPSTRYFWRVFATDGAGDTTESSRWNFTTDAAAGIESSFSAGLSMHARASGAGVELELTLASPAGARIEIVDAQGAIVRSWTEPQLRAGRNLIAIEGEELAEGAYFARAAVGGASASCRFAIVR